MTTTTIYNDLTAELSALVLEQDNLIKIETHITPQTSPVRVKTPNAPKKKVPKPYVLQSIQELSPVSVLEGIEPNTNHNRNRKAIKNMRKKPSLNPQASRRVEGKGRVVSKMKKLEKQLRELKIEAMRTAKQPAFAEGADPSHSFTLSDPLGMKELAGAVNSPVLQETLRNFNDVASAVKSPGKNFLDMIRPGIAMCEENKELILFSAFASALIYQCISRTKASHATFMVSAGAVLLLTDNKMDYFTAIAAVHIVWAICPSQSSDEEIIADSQGLGDLSMEDLGGVLSTLSLGVTGVKHAMGDSRHNFFKEITNWSRGKENINEIIDLVIRCVDNMFKVVSIHLLGNNTYTSFLVNSDADFEAIKKRIDHIESLQRVNECNPTVENSVYVNVTIEMLEHLHCKIPHNNSTRGMTKIISDHIHILRKIKQRFLDQGMNTTFMRPEPAVVYIAGAPSNGKTQVASSMALILTEMILTLEKERFHGKSQDPTDYLYLARKSPFADTLPRDALVGFHDDFGQEKDVPGDANSEAMAFIRLVNTVGNPAEKAAVEDKGKFKYEPKAVILTSNDAQIKSEVVKHPGALIRRVDYAYYGVPKERYCIKDPSSRDDSFMTKRLDRSKLPKLPNGDSKFGPDMMDFVPYDMKTGKVLGRRMGYAEVIVQQFKMVETKKRWHETRLRDLSTISKDFFSKYPKYRGGTEVAEAEGWLWNDPEEEEPDSEDEKDAMNYIAASRRVEILEAHSGWYDSPSSSESEEEEYESSLGAYPPSIREGVRDIMSGGDHTREFKELVYGLAKIGMNYITNDWWFPKVVASCLVFYGKKFAWFAGSRVTMNDDGSLITPQELYDRWEGECDWEGYVQMFDLNAERLGDSWSTMKIKRETLYHKLMRGASDVLYNSYTFLKKHKDTLEVVFGVLSMLALAGALTSVVGYFNGWFDKVVPNSESTNIEFKPRKDISFKSQMTHSVSRANAEALDPNTNSLMDSVVSTNCYNFQVETPDGDLTRWGNVTMLNASYFIIPYHFINRLKRWQTKVGAKPVVLSQFQGKREFMLTFDEILNNYFINEDLEFQDVALVKTPPRIQPHRDIVRFFYDEVHSRAIQSSMTVRIDPWKSGAHMPHTGEALPAGRVRVRDSYTETEYALRAAVSYSTLHTAPGDCGVLLSLLGKSGCILGIHSAGTPTSGYGVIVSKQMLCKALIEANPIASSEAYNLPSLQFKCLGPAPVKVSTSGDHTLVRSKLFGELDGFPSLKRPSRLFPNNNGDPKVLCYDGYCSNDRIIPQDVLTKAIHQKLDHLERTDNDKARPRLLHTFEQAVEGIYEFDESAPLNFSTSTGYPLMKRYKTKRHFFGEPVDYHRDCVVDLRREASESIEKMNNGELVQFIFIDFLKAELLKKQKVEDAKTRLICGASLLMIIVSRILCGDFMLMVVRGRIRNNSCIGINETSSDWNSLAQHLTYFSSHLFAGDYKGFDKKHTYQLIMSICSLVNKWYNDSYQTARVMLFESIARSVHYVNGELYEWDGGMPSGNPLTAVINTLINEILMICCFILLVGTKTKFHDKVRAAFVGDDNVVAPSPDVSDEFNAVTVAKQLDNFGYIYTDESKQSVTEALKPITDVDFLKRKFRFERTLGRYVGPIDLNTPMESLQWTQRSDPYGVTADKIQSSIREFSLHGEETFNLLTPLVLKAYTKNYGQQARWPSSTDYATVLDEIESEPRVYQ